MVQKEQRKLQPGGLQSKLTLDGVDSLRFFGVFDAKVGSLRPRCCLHTV